jgi:DNA invertase Pin-like site-specific DNA recombinase
MKAIIYNRTSTEDQKPELQLKECEDYCKKRGWEIIDRLEEKESAYKDESKRKIFQSMIERAKKGEFNHIVVWNMDRFSRQPEEDVLNLSQMLSLVYSVQIHAVNGDAWSEMVESIGRLREMGFIGKAIAEFLEKLIKGMEFQRAYRESKTKSERVKLAIRKGEGVTKSYKGKLWGHHSLSKKVDEEIIDLHKQGKKLREIKELVSYWDKNNNKKFVSLGYVHKILDKFKRENISKTDVQEVDKL